MQEFLEANVILLAIAAIVLVLAIWWLVAASRRTSVDLTNVAEDTTVRRNQALIDAAPVAPAPPVAAPPVAAMAPSPLPSVAEAVPAAVPDAPMVSVPDDSAELTRIKGLGPKLAEQLRALGVTSLSQIAAWDDADIDRIDAQLGRFQGRIRRDDWREQARLLSADDTAGYEARFGKLNR